ncbi:MFS transporter [Finegoldia magna]|uniref:MFS transporter n=1 Tax=Finegoldia magna TaxID=1260 RepID=UPI0030C88A90
MKKAYIMNLFSNLIFYAPVALLVRTNKGITMPQFFILQAILSITCMAFEFPLGILTDKIGLKKSIVLGQFIMLIARITLILANNFWVFAIEAFFEGIAFALNSGTVSAYIYNLFGEHNYSNNISKFYNFGTIAFILSTVLFPFINSKFNIEGLIIVTIVANFISFLVSVFLPNSTSKDDDVEKINIIHSIKKLASDKKFREIILIVSLINLSFLLVNFFYVQILIENGYSESIISPLILVYSAIQLSQPYIIRFMGEKNSSKKIQKMSFIASIFFIMICFVKKAPLILFMVILPTILSVLGVFVEKYQNNYVDEIQLKDYRATILSAFNFFADVFEVVFLLLNSYISSFNYKYVFLFISLLFIGNIINSVFTIKQKATT